MGKALFLIILFSAFYWSASQSYVNYSEKDGLPSNHVYKITQDVDGFIWIATDEGLVKYNGSEFKVFTTQDGLPTNDIYNMYPAKDGKLWYISKSTSLGYIFNNVVYDFKTKKEGDGLNPIMTGFTGNEIIPSSSYSSNILNSDNLWEEVDYNFDKNYINQQYLKNDKYKGVVISKKDLDKLYLITHDNEYIKIDKANFNPENYYRMQITDSLFMALSPTDYSFINLNNLKTQKIHYQQELGVTNLKLCRIHLANEEIQISGENFVAILNKDLKPKHTVHIPEKLKSHYSFIDRENTLWIATFANGFYKYSLSEDRLKKEYSNYKIHDIKEVNEDIIALVNNSGFYRYDSENDEFKLFIDREEFLYDSQYIKETNTSYFISHKEIQLEKNEATSKNLIYREFYDVLGRSLCYHNGFIYGYNTSGVIKMNPTDINPLKYYYLNSVRCLTSFNDRLLIGVSNGLYELKNDEFKKVDSLSTFKKPVTDLLPIDKEHLLLCTSGYGIYLTDLNTVELLEGSEFLKANNPCFIDNSLYVPTNKGIYQYEYQNNKMKLHKVWDNTNGLPTNKVNGVQKVEDQLLVATNQGLVHFPLDYQVNQQLVDLYFENTTYGDINLISQPTVNFTDNSDLQITVKSIDYRNNSNLNYEFRLLPTQKEWTMTQSSNLTFTDLSPNEYVLEIKSETLTRSLPFKVEPRWFQSWIFYLAMLLALITLVIAVTKYLTKKSENKRNEKLLQDQQFSQLQLKALRSQMNPHFVFNSLTAIQYYINENDFETSDRYLVKFSRLIREFFDLSKEQLVSIKREASLLENYLALEKLRFKGKLNYNINIDSQLDKESVLPSMLLQPLVENAVNHGVFNKSSDGHIDISFTRISDNKLQVSIQDDGKGFIENEDDDRYKSTSVLEDRLKYLRQSGSWEIDIHREDVYPDQKEKGHRVTLSLKNISK